MVGGFWNPWGRTLQQYCFFVVCLGPATQKQKFPVTPISNTENQVLVNSKVASRVQGLDTAGCISSVASLTA